MKDKAKFKNETDKKMTENRLEYIQEHLTCKNYAKESPMLYIVRLPKDRQVNRDRMDSLTLVFVLEGELSVTTGIHINKEVVGGNMFIIPEGDCAYMRGIADTTLMLCRLNTPMSLCNEFSLKQLFKHIPQISQEQTESCFAVLPVAELLMVELNITKQAMESRLLCYHYLEVKREIFLLMLRAFYLKEELAFLFKPILSEDFDFKKLVLTRYTYEANAQQLASLLNLSTATFNHKFEKNFGTTVGKWLISKKKENILRDLLMTELSLKEITDKYDFTPNYFIYFCKKHFGNTPAGLREANKQEAVF